MYDRGRSSGQIINSDNKKDIPKIVRRISKQNMPISIISPLSLESMFLSFKYLISKLLINYNIQESIYKDFHNYLSSIVNDGLDDNIEYDKLCTKANCSSIERLVEESIEQITFGTTYSITHSPSAIAECWLYNCCEKEAESHKCNKDDINLATRKLEFITEHSALGAITFIIDKIYGIHYRRYPLGMLINENYRNKLIPEV